MPKRPDPRHLRGRAAEFLGCTALALRGYRILRRNYSRSTGEIDIIAGKRSVLAFVEVRLRAGHAFGSGLESVGIAKQRRIQRTAAQFLAQHASYTAHQIRFDVISIGLRDSRSHLRPTFRWVQNAFSSEDLTPPFHLITDY